MQGDVHTCRINDVRVVKKSKYVKTPTVGGHISSHSFYVAYSVSVAIYLFAHSDLDFL